MDEVEREKENEVNETKRNKILHENVREIYLNFTSKPLSPPEVKQEAHHGLRGGVYISHSLSLTSALQCKSLLPYSTQHIYLPPHTYTSKYCLTLQLQ